MISLTTPAFILIVVVVLVLGGCAGAYIVYSKE